MDAKTSRRFQDMLLKHYLCAGCWGLLTMRFHDGTGWTIECAADPSHAGFVTSFHVAYRRMASDLEAAEVKSFYADILGIQRANASAGSLALYGDGEGL